MALVSASWLCSRIKTSFTVVIIVIVLFAIVSSGVIGVASRFYNPDQVYGFERIYYYATALQLFTTHPLLGVGAGNYQFFDRSYEGEAAGGIAHNQLLTMAAETGLVGLAFFLWLVLRLARFRRKLHFDFESLDGSYEWVKVAGSAFILLWIAECFFQEAFFAMAAAGGGTRV